MDYKGIADGLTMLEEHWCNYFGDEASCGDCPMNKGIGNCPMIVFGRVSSAHKACIRSGMSHEEAVKLIRKIEDNDALSGREKTQEIVELMIGRSMI